MSEDILTDLADMIREHPWWQARASLMLALLKANGIQPPARVLDAGCGWGTNLEYLERNGYRAIGLDISRRALQRLDRPDRELIEADLTQALPGQVAQFDAVIALDVIEHLDDDRTAVTRLGQLAKPGGLVILSVPALPSLISEFDVVQGHRRRYLPPRLRDSFAGSGLAVKQVLWWGSWMVPLLRMQRRVAQTRSRQSPAEVYRRYLQLPPWPIRLAFRLAFALDEMRTLNGRALTGTSLFAVARRTT
jgi:SAM-dependent methyltransferase